MLEGRAEVQRVYEGMVSLGIVEHVGEKHLGRFRAVRYPEKDHAPEAALLEKIRAALSGPPSHLEVPDTTVRLMRPLPARLTPGRPVAKPGSKVPDPRTISPDRPASGGRTARQALPRSGSNPGG